MCESSAPRAPWQEQSNAGDADAEQQKRIRITHPFHPLRDQSFRFVVSKQIWGEDRVSFQHPDGSLRSVPVGWTDFLPPDPYHSVGQGRSRFRAEDLMALADLISGKRSG